MIARTLLAGLVLLGSAALAEDRTPLALDDIHRVATVAEPDVSPDGQRVAYSVAIDDLKNDRSTSDLWTVAVKGGEPRRLTSTPAISEYQPRFSRDGRWLAYLSDEKPGEAGKEPESGDAAQLWLMPAGGGAARKVSNLPGGISDYSLSPDGRQAVVVAEVGSNVGSEARVAPPVVIDRFFFKSDGSGYLGDRVQQLFLVDLATGEARQLTRGERDHWHPVWSPDGRWIAFTARDRDRGDRHLDYNVFVMPAGGGDPRRLSPLDGIDDDPDWEGRPAWSPDSRKLVWLEAAEDKWIYYGVPQLAVADIATGKVTRPGRIDRWFYKPRWSADGKSILALVELDRVTWLARIDAGSGKLSYLSRGDRFATDFAEAPDGTIALLDGDDNRPAELRLVGGKERPLTHHNDWLASRRLGTARDFAFPSGDVEIHGILLLPSDYQPGKRYPLILALHGGPVYQRSHEFDFGQHFYAANGYAVLAINPRGSSGRGFDFSRAIYADWGNLDAKDISAGLDAAIARGIADPERVGAGGWSYGGILTDYMIASEPRIRAAISGAGAGNPLALYGVDMYAREYELELGRPWEATAHWEKLGYPFLHADRIKAPTMFQCAGDDDNVPCAGAQQMYTALKSLGVPTRLIVYPDATHSLDVPSYQEDRLRRNVAWYDQWLKR